MNHHDKDEEQVKSFLSKFDKASFDEKAVMLQKLKLHKADAELSKIERIGLKKVYCEELVKRSALLKIAAVWIITVPTSGMMLP